MGKTFVSLPQHNIHRYEYPLYRRVLRQSAWKAPHMMHIHATWIYWPDHGVRMLWQWQQRPDGCHVCQCGTGKKRAGHGVIPNYSRCRKAAPKVWLKLLVVDGMHTRKGLMYEKCDAAVIPAGWLWRWMSFWNAHLESIEHTRQTYLPAKQPWFYNHLVAHIHPHV